MQQAHPGSDNTSVDKLCSVEGGIRETFLDRWIRGKLDTSNGSKVQCNSNQGQGLSNNDDRRSTEDKMTKNALPLGMNIVFGMIRSRTNGI